MSVMIKQMVGCSVLAICTALPVGAGESPHAGWLRHGQCQEKTGHGVHAAQEELCVHGRIPRKLQGAAQPARGRDALLQYRSGEHRPRMVRAALDMHAVVLIA